MVKSGSWKIMQMNLAGYSIEQNCILLLRLTESALPQLVRNNQTLPACDTLNSDINWGMVIQQLGRRDRIVMKPLLRDLISSIFNIKRDFYDVYEQLKHCIPIVTLAPIGIYP